MTEKRGIIERRFEVHCADPNCCYCHTNSSLSTIRKSLEKGGWAKVDNMWFCERHRKDAVLVRIKVGSKAWKWLKKRKLLKLERL